MNSSAPARSVTLLSIHTITFVGLLFVVLLQLCSCTQPLFSVHSGSRPCHSPLAHFQPQPQHAAAERRGTAHPILLEYSPHSTAHSFAALAARHDITGGRDVVRRWHNRWDGTPQSLQHKAVSGRPRVLSTQQVRRHIAAPIRNSNRAHRAVRYTKLLPQVQAATGSQLSLRTLQRYGKEEAGGRRTRGKKRTAEECECNSTCVLLLRSFSVLCVHCHICTCPCLTFSVPRAVRADRPGATQAATHRHTTHPLSR